jgi:hypothetical protein
LKDLTDAKTERNELGWPLTVPYSFVNAQGKVITIKGVPDLGAIQIAMLGIKNPSKKR